jgi:hypothetical protein
MQQLERANNNLAESMITGQGKGRLVFAINNIFSQTTKGIS